MVDFRVICPRRMDKVTKGESTAREKAQERTLGTPQSEIWQRKTSKGD